MKIAPFVFSIFVFSAALGQETEIPANSRLVSLTAGAGSFRGTFSLDFIQWKKMGGARKFGIGAGVRFSGFVGKNQYYITAPAILTSGSRGPQVIFKQNIVANIDSFLIQTPQVNLLNLVVGFDYRLSKKLTAGFNIDVVGFSFGKKVRGNYINGYEGRMEDANPSAFNLLLISDNDKGSLNSELYLAYGLKSNLGIKAGAQFLFTEYKTKSNVQVIPAENDRFRNKSLLFSAGLIVKLNKAK